MTSLDVEPDEEGLKILCADLILLLTLDHSENPIDKSELKERTKKRNKDGDLVYGSPSNQKMYKRSLNTRLSMNIERNYIQSERGEYQITEGGQERVQELLEKTKSHL